MNLNHPHADQRLNFLDRENVALISVLEDKGRVIIVGNTHILWNYKRADIKLGDLSFELSSSD